jgi:hypothetical protein
MTWDADKLENTFFAIIALIALYLAWRGWKQGIARQLMTIVAIVSAYATAWFGAEKLEPFFAFLGFVPQFNRIVAGAAGGMVVFLLISVFGKSFFKKTKQHEEADTRLKFGLFGALVGLAFSKQAFTSDGSRECESRKTANPW